VVAFYRDGLGLQMLSRFEDHEGFDGVMLGGPGAQWHLEFTTHRRRPAERTPGPEDLLVLYLPDPAAWREAVARLERFGAPRVAAANPYWDRAGATFEDPDGRRVVLQNAAWTA
jgi:catechol 2,3-dioxygenase-like lactoylglutathione lyase family enzyme